MADDIAKIRSSSARRRLSLVGAASSECEASSEFEQVLSKHGVEALKRALTTTLQINMGKLCNMACQHCHVDAGPKRREIMTAAVADRILELIRRSPAIAIVDITGGAPELNPNFTSLVLEARRLGRRVIDRCNLSILLEPGQEGLASFLAEQEVRIIASLPCYQEGNVDKQRGKGAFERSIRALKLLNRLGYGRPGSNLVLDLVYNPTGAFLPPAQEELELQYKSELFDRHGISFHGLLTITNMPISRFAHTLDKNGERERYMDLLASRFNRETLPGLMCRTLVSVGWDGRLYDCDFNQMLDVGLAAGQLTIWDIDRLDDMVGKRIATGAHCLGCTAGAGSSCGGALAN